MPAQGVHHLALGKPRLDGVIRCQGIDRGDAEALARGGRGGFVIGRAIGGRHRISQRGTVLRRHVDGLV
jgi:hypothetical protein